MRVNEIRAFIAICLCVIFSGIFFQTCCFADDKLSNDKRTQTFLVLSDIHLDKYTKRRMSINPYFYSTSNDLDEKTFTDLLTNTKNNIKNGLIPKPKFILVLGDIVGHKRDSQQWVYGAETETFSLLKKYFAPIPIFYVFGNNDSHMDDYGLFSDDKNHSPYATAKKSGWKNGFLSTGTMCTDDDNFTPCLENENKKNGYYTAYIADNLKLIALNSVLFSNKAADNIANQEAAQAELDWLANQLKKASASYETALIAMHIPVGRDILSYQNFWKSSYKKAFLRLIDDYKDTIIGILGAHTHLEELKVLYDGNRKNPTLMIYTAGLSTSRGNSPSIKSFELSEKDDNWAISNYTTFSFSQTQKHHLTLHNLYNFKDYYCKHIETDDITDCADNVTADKISKYYTAGNRNFSGFILLPQGIIIDE